MSQNTPESSGASTAVFISALKNGIGEERFEILFGQLKCRQLNRVLLELELPNATFVRSMEQDFSDELEQATRSVLGPWGRFVLKSAMGSPPESEQSSPGQISGGYVRIPHRWADELISRVGVGPWCVFQTLLRFVWRGETTLKPLQACLERGDLVAYVSMTKIAQNLGLSLRSVQSHLQKLEDFGLLRATRRPCGRAHVYVLGRVEAGHEQWFAELIL